MAESLRRVVDMDTFSVLQEKLDCWLDDYHHNSCDQNVDRCLEVIELNSRIQGQLLKILQQSAAEGGSVIGARILPWLTCGALGPSFFQPRSLATEIEAWSEVANKEREIVDLKDHYEISIEEIEADLHSTKEKAEQLQLELTGKDIELEAVKRNSTSDKMFAENELHQLRNRVMSMEEELTSLRLRGHLVDSYEHEIRRLRDELIRLMEEPTKALRNRDLDGLRSLPFPSSTRSRSPSPKRRLYEDDYGTAEDKEGGFDSQGIVQKYRQQRLIDRFSDLFIRDRRNSLDTLRRFSDDSERNKNILFHAIQESFMVSRLAFINFKMRVRSTLAPVHTGSGTLEQAVQDYINRNPDLYNLTDMVSEAIRNLDRRRILPDGVSCSVLQSFIREACRVAWGFASLARPLETAPAADYELYDPSKYRRSFDSDVTAPLVLFHVWPCLTQGNRVIVKGEAHTANASTRLDRGRGGFLRSPNSAHGAAGRSRSPSPGRQ